MATKMTSSSNDVRRLNFDQGWRKVTDPSSPYFLTNSNFPSMGTKLEWILDSGASYHMTGNVRLMRNAEKLVHIPVTLPNDEITHATHMGDVWLSSTVLIRNVLLVPRLKCNLISIARLVDNPKCDIFFSNDICVIQDQLSRMLIGMGKQHGGVYYFHSFDEVQAHQVKSVDSIDLWHSRLGHPSMKVLCSIPSLNKYFSSLGLNKNCDACLRGQQTHDVFPINSARAIEPFELN
ncbi:unnamed protein product [Cuscuta europaea]|uniref:GAG-pre-integrase domain-containing protein n=1 Tax=Cuscuta europaea TaxID=41803 RepID=A0A9P1EA76_CUSEU|nr:unnamed protein product [Cuscuta europaea]